MEVAVVAIGVAVVVCVCVAGCSTCVVCRVIAAVDTF